MPGSYRIRTYTFFRHRKASSVCELWVHDGEAGREYLKKRLETHEQDPAVFNQFLGMFRGVVDQVRLEDLKKNKWSFKIKEGLKRGIQRLKAHNE